MDNLKTNPSAKTNPLKTNRVGLSDSELPLELDLKNFEKQEGSASERAVYSIYQNTFTVGQGSWLDLYYRPSQLPDPLVWKIMVSIKPLSGDPDLHIYGYDFGGQGWRLIRSSANLGLSNELSSFRKTDLQSVEDRAYMSIFGETATTFEVTIYGQSVDCKEFEAADQIVTKEYAPVCGCDGFEYGNPAMAKVAGITSWEEGECLIGTGSDIGGAWRNSNFNYIGLVHFFVDVRFKDIEAERSCRPSNCKLEKSPLVFHNEGFYTTTIEDDDKIYQAKLTRRGTYELEVELTTTYIGGGISREILVFDRPFRF